jgi:predicted GNAT family acetyltransferase
VNHLQKQHRGVNDVALACIYFNYKEKEMIANVLKQLWERTSKLSSQAQALYSLHQDRHTKPSVKEISLILRAESDRVSTFFIILDALDEFNQPQEEFEETQNARVSLLVELRQIPNRES